MKVAFYATSAESLYRFRLPVARRLAEAGYQVIFVTPRDDYAEKIEAADFGCVRFEAVGGFPPFSDIASGFRLAKLYRQEEPDIVHHFGMDAIVQGGTAARSAGLPWVVHSFPNLKDGGASSRWLGPGRRWILRRATRGAEVTIQSLEDRQLLIAKGCIRPEQAHVLGGDVIDPERIAFVPEPDRAPVIAFVSDVDSSSDMEVFADAARLVQEDSKLSRTRFAVISKDMGVPDDIRTRLHHWQEQGLIEWWPRQNVDEALQHVHVVYAARSRSYAVRSRLLTAAALGRPIVAGDTPGCRDLVRDGVTGALVTPGDADALAAAFRGLLEDARRRRQMGRSARSFIENDHAAGVVARHIMAVYQRLFERGREI